MTLRTRFGIILVTAPILAFVVVGGLLARTLPRDEAYPHLRIFDEVFSLTTNGYVEAVDPGRLMHGAMHGLVEALDADSAYLTRDEARAASGATADPPGDVGLVLTRQYYLRVVAALPGSPAAAAGLRSGDYLRVIDRKPTRDMSAWEGMRSLRGAVGSTVTLTVLRGNATDAHVVTLTRARLTPPRESTSMAADGIGVITPGVIDASAPALLRTAAATLQKSGARALILDLRNAAVGTIGEGLTAARVFVGSGTLGHLETRNAERRTFTAEAGDGSVTLPLVVLVDGGTSGAAEILAAALQGTKRADLIGERTAGRVAQQRLFPLPDGSALWMSYAYYLSAAGQPIHERGLQPDVVVEEPDLEFGAAPAPGDPARERAIERLRARSGS
jgi:carboxyl-terminal processing protease